DEGTQGTVLLDIRGQIRIAEGDADGGAEDLTEAGERLVSWGMVNPTLHGWRTKRPLALFALGDESGAREQADEALRLAPRAGPPRGPTAARCRRPRSCAEGTSRWSPKRRRWPCLTARRPRGCAPPR